MDNVDQLLGGDPTSDADRLAEELARADFVWVDQLVRLRKQSGMSQADVAKAMGRSQSVVSDVETMSSDPRISTLRRYAMAIGAVVKHRVSRQPSPHPLLSSSTPTVTAHAVTAGSDQATSSSSRFLQFPAAAAS